MADHAHVGDTRPGGHEGQSGRPQAVRRRRGEIQFGVVGVKLRPPGKRHHVLRVVSSDHIGALESRDSTIIHYPGAPCMLLVLINVSRNHPSQKTRGCLSYRTSHAETTATRPSGRNAFKRAKSHRLMALK